MTRAPQAPSILWFKSSSDPIEKTEEGERTNERERERNGAFRRTAGTAE